MRGTKHREKQRKAEGLDSRLRGNDEGVALECYGTKAYGTRGDEDVRNS